MVEPLTPAPAARVAAGRGPTWAAAAEGAGLPALEAGPVRAAGEVRRVREAGEAVIYRWVCHRLVEYGRLLCRCRGVRRLRPLK